MKNYIYILFLALCPVVILAGTNGSNSEAFVSLTPDPNKNANDDYYTRASGMPLKGHLAVYSVETKNSNEIQWLVFYMPSDSNKAFCITCSASGMTKMIRAEFPDGLPTGKIPIILHQLIVQKWSSGSAERPLTQIELSDMVSSVRDGEALPFQRAIVKNMDLVRELFEVDSKSTLTIIKDNFWGAYSTTMNSQGGVYLRYFSGNLKPFSMTEYREVVLIEDFLGSPTNAYWTEEMLKAAIKMKQEFLSQEAGVSPNTRGKP